MGEIAIRASISDFLNVGKNSYFSHGRGIKAGIMSLPVTKLKSQSLTTRIRVRIKTQMVMNQSSSSSPSTYTSRIFTDIPLYETPIASFDQYLEDKPRVFKAMFPDKQRSHRLNEEEWRVHMLPIDFLFITVYPVIDMRLRCKTNGTEYPSGISPAISKVLELDIVRWELKGLDDAAKPTQFSLGVKGALYPDRRGLRPRLKGQLEMTISVILPPMLSLVPEYMLRSVSETVLRTLVENMKDKVNSSLLADYSEFRRERQMKPVQTCCRESESVTLDSS